ncbi:MAG: phosphonate degradation HD-domain oxygenase [Actinomycetota bacterium]
MTPVAVFDEIAELFDTRGAAAYLGEPVSMNEHMLQTAHVAERAGAPAALVAAALLHDIGHFLHGFDDDAADHGIDTAHEHTGADWLRTRFVDAVSEPVRLHVAAKRYLCATDPTYLAQLSVASVHSLGLQGGALSPAEVDEFARRPSAEDAVLLRRWDDCGKIAGGATPPLAHFEQVLLAVMRGAGADDE